LGHRRRKESNQSKSTRRIRNPFRGGARRGTRKKQGLRESTQITSRSKKGFGEKGEKSNFEEWGTGKALGGGRTAENKTDHEEKVAENPNHQKQKRKYKTHRSARKRYRRERKKENCQHIQRGSAKTPRQKANRGTQRGKPERLWKRIQGGGGL